jgi:hypothetical protein
MSTLTVSTPSRPPSLSSFGTNAPNIATIDESSVADFLLQKKYHLAALELHQELLESNNGVHNVASLNRFFNDATLFDSLVKSTEKKANDFRAKGMFCLALV